MIRNLTGRIALVAVLLVVAATPWAQAPLIGRLSFPTSETGRAQDAFERGVLYLHNFEYDDAIIAFREAQGLSRNFAMAYWGEAYALGPNINAPMDPGAVSPAWAAIQQALQIQAGVVQHLPGGQRAAALKQVAAAQLLGGERERVGDLVEVALHGEDALRGAEAAEGAVRRAAGGQGAAAHADVVTGVGTGGVDGPA